MCSEKAGISIAPAPVRCSRFPWKKKHGVNGHLRQKGKIAELALGYGGGTGALTAMGALEMGLKEEELQPLVTAWRNSNPNIVKFWWAVDNAVMTAITERTSAETHGLKFARKSGMLFYHPSLRQKARLREASHWCEPVRRGECYLRRCGNRQEVGTH